MTYEERSKQLCEQCRHKDNCGFKTRNMQDSCIDNETIMSGWELGQQDTIEEIEAILNKGSKNSCDDFFTIAEIERKIKQLKEE